MASSIAFEPFGAVHAATGLDTGLRFPGQVYHWEPSLHQNWMRDYDPSTGRYIQADPLGLVDGASVYGYALQSPGRYTDPRGEAIQFAPAIWGLMRWGAGRFLGSLGGRGAAIGALDGAAAGVPSSPSGPGTGAIAPGASGKIDPMPNVRARVTAAEANGQCPDPCDKARVRVDNAKRATSKLGGCRPSDLANGTLYRKIDAWKEHWNARKQRDRVCKNGPQGKATPEGEALARYNVCRTYAICMSLSR